MSIGTHSILKRKISKNQREENDSEGKNVSLCCIILLLIIFGALMNLRSHIAFFCSFIIFEFEYFSVLKEARSEPEVTDFETLYSTLCKNENVLQFKITMSDSWRMKISYSLNNTFKSASFGTHFRVLFSKIVEQAAFGGMLKNEDVIRGGFFKLLIGFITRKDNILAISKTLHDVFVV